MGSFNEACALTSFDIPHGTPVKLLFLTQNPYRTTDEHETERGIYHNAHWFPRTPPFNAIYNDYGRATFEEGPITDLILRCFRKDVVERPFGSNPYHTKDVTATKNIYHYLEAAFQGRLQVWDNPEEKTQEPPEHFPTWDRVHALLKRKNLPLQSENDEGDGGMGYNARPIVRGAVFVTFQGEQRNQKLKLVDKLLKEQYDTKFMKDDELGLMVTAKGAFEDTTILHDHEWFSEKLSVIDCFGENQKLSVLAVMIRQDVWDIFKKLMPTPHLALRDAVKSKNHLFLQFMSAGVGIVRQTSPITHLAESFGVKDFPAEVTEELLQSFEELSSIERVMNLLHIPWHIPPLGGQDGKLERSLRKTLMGELHALSKKLAK